MGQLMSKKISKEPQFLTLGAILENLHGKDAALDLRKILREFHVTKRNQLDPDLWENIAERKKGIIRDKNWEYQIKCLINTSTQARTEGWEYSPKEKGWKMGPGGGKSEKLNTQPPPYVVPENKTSQPAQDPVPEKKIYPDLTTLSGSEICNSPYSGWHCKCGYPNPEKTEMCYHCGGQKGDQRIQRHSHASTPQPLGGPYDPRHSWICSNCGQQNPGWRDTCLACGAGRWDTIVNLAPVHLRRDQVRERGADNQYHTVPINKMFYKPWSPAECMALVQNAPDPLTKPTGYSRYLAQVMNSHNATWQDGEDLCRMKMPSTMFTQFLGIAGNGRPVGNDAREENSRAQFLTALANFCTGRQRERGIIAIATQGSTQLVSDYFLTLEQNYLDEGLDMDNEAVQRLFVRAFVDGLKPQIKDRLKACTPDWRTAAAARVLLEKAQGIELDLKDAPKKGVIAYVGDGTQGVRPRRAVVCYYCNKPGHIKRNCRKRIADQQEEVERDQDKEEQQRRAQRPSGSRSQD